MVRKTRDFQEGFLKEKDWGSPQSAMGGQACRPQGGWVFTREARRRRLQGQKIAMDNAECLCHARPCASALSCPTAQQARHPDTTLPRQLGHWKAVTRVKLLNSYHGRVGTETQNLSLQSLQRTAVLFGLWGSVSIWGQEGATHKGSR